MAFRLPSLKSIKDELAKVADWVVPGNQANWYGGRTGGLVTAPTPQNVQRAVRGVQQAGPTIGRAIVNPIGTAIQATQAPRIDVGRFLGTSVNNYFKPTV